MEFTTNLLITDLNIMRYFVTKFQTKLGYLYFT